MRWTPVARNACRNWSPARRARRRDRSGVGLVVGPRRQRHVRPRPRAAVGRGAAKKAAPSHRSRRPPRLRGARLSGAYLAGTSGTALGARRAEAGAGPVGTSDNRRNHSDISGCEVLLERYGVVTKGAVHNEGVAGGFSRIYRALTVFEDSGKGAAGLLRRRSGRCTVCRTRDGRRAS